MARFKWDQKSIKNVRIIKYVHFIRTTISKNEFNENEFLLFSVINYVERSHFGFQKYVCFTTIIKMNQLQKVQLAVSELSFAAKTSKPNKNKVKQSRVKLDANKDTK